MPKPSNLERKHERRERRVNRILDTAQLQRRKGADLAELRARIADWMLDDVQRRRRIKGKGAS